MSARASAEITHSVWHISPVVARSLLEGGHRNRNLRAERVKELAAAMRRGEWDLNGATIKLDEDGRLLDGQHRLAAILDSGVGIDAVVVSGLPASAQNTIDIGSRRRLSDVLCMEGYDDTHMLAAAVNVLHRYRMGKRIGFSRAYAPTPQEALDLIARDPQIVRSVEVARGVTRAIGGPVGVFGALHCVFVGVDPDPAGEFFERLRDGVHLEAGDAVLKLRDQIMLRRTDPTFFSSTAHVTALTIKAFNFQRENRQIASLVYRSNEEFPAVALPRKTTSA